MLHRLKAYLRLMRPANIVTAVSDILAGIAIAGYVSVNEFHEVQFVPVLFLVLATVGLYGGGVVFNDVFDAKLDAVERPERPIPGGIVKESNAALLGSALLAGGVLAAFFAHQQFFPSGLLALIIAVAALTYDKWGKHHPFLGPLNMGICRGLNLLLGMSVLASIITKYAWISVIPVVYVAAITMVSRGEVYGGKKTVLYTAAFFYLLVIASILFISYANNTIVYSFLFLLLFGVMIFTPLQKAIHDPKGSNVGKAVKAGVLALILMNAAWAAAFGTIYLALLIVLLLPVSILMAKTFAVT
jgi:4-hydroxybenzoate polyprenyltransferase